MVEAIFQNISLGATSFLTFFKTMLQNVISVFWTAGTSGGEGSLTDVGILLLVGLGTSFALMGFSLVKNLIKLRG